MPEADSMPMLIVLLSDGPGDDEGGSQSYKVNIPAELAGENLSQYTVDRAGNWRKNGSPTVVASSTMVAHAKTTNADAPAVLLISCVSKKTTYPCPAQDLYISAWFKKARRFAEESRLPWFILSAEYGMVRPDETIAPYERTLNKMNASERRLWGQRVRHQMKTMLPNTPRIIILAGIRYREHLMPYLRTRAAFIEIPLEGLRIGQQLAWFAKQKNRWTDSPT